MTDIDSIVKGAAVPSQAVKDNVGPGPIPAVVSGKAGDPTNNAPNTPSMIYLNLLILEASLRAQYLELRARRRHHTFFFSLLTLWVVYFGYQLFFAPREDGVGVGGSIYWAVEGAQKVCFMGGIITAILVWAVGIWERGIRWPRRWFAISNRGLRGFNCKLVIIRRPWWAEAISTIVFFLTYGLFSHTASSSYRLVDPSLLREVEKELQISGDSHPTLILPQDDEERGGHEEDLAPGGDYVKLLLLAKPFSATFRENWELYRTEYWERENERRALLRQKVKENDRRLAKQQYGWFWWLPWHQAQAPQQAHKPSPHRPHHHPDKERKRRSSSVRRGSTSSSRSPTPVAETEDGHVISRKASNASTASKERRKKNASISRPKRPTPDSRSVTPEFPSPLSRESSVDADSGPEGGRLLRSSAARAKSASSDK
jgi:hypothetical protein